MPLNLDDSIAWTTADADERAMLADLQGNILKGHGRHATLNLFLRFGGNANHTKLMLRKLGALTISALDQLRAAESYQMARKYGTSGRGTPTFFTVLLSAAGYAKLGIKAPQDQAFEQGMLARAAILSDDPAKIDHVWQERPDAMVLIAADPDDEHSWESAAIGVAETAVTNIVIGLGGSIPHKQAGRAVFRTQQGSTPEGIEHFGYADGRSQPLLLKESIAAEAAGATLKWDPDFPLRQVLVADPQSVDRRGFGSFFVFRKLEQNVAAFNKAEDALAELTDTETGKKLGDLGGAMMVGRFEDGTPVTVHSTPQGGKISNDFDYASDMDGLRCPFHGHIRKTNPRGDTARLFSDGTPAGQATTLAKERQVIMARRGITYGKRNRTLDPNDAPAGGVGLLFMAYQSSIVDQFEFTQQSWANEPKFAPGFKDQARAPGRDPIIGQRGTNGAALNPVRHAWNKANTTTTPTDFGEHVTHRGGEYFFAPARSTLLTL